MSWEKDEAQRDECADHKEKAREKLLLRSFMLLHGRLCCLRGLGRFCTRATQPLVSVGIALWHPLDHKHSSVVQEAEEEWEYLWRVRLHPAFLFPCPEPAAAAHRCQTLGERLLAAESGTRRTWACGTRESRGQENEEKQEGGERAEGRGQREGRERDARREGLQRRESQGRRGRRERYRSAGREIREEGQERGEEGRG
jgi:hypothetical protein